jgi:hypothetical protein
VVTNDIDSYCPHVLPCTSVPDISSCGKFPYAVIADASARKGYSMVGLTVSDSLSKDNSHAFV